MVEKIDQKKTEEAITLFLKCRDVEQVAKETDLSVEQVRDLVLKHKKDIKEIVDEIQDLTLHKDEDGKVDVEKSLEQMQAVFLRGIRSRETGLDPKELVDMFGEARKQLELQAKMQGKLGVYDEITGTPQNFKQYLIQNLNVIAKQDRSIDVHPEPKRVKE